MNGSVYRRKSGWAYQIDLPRDAEGKRRRLTKSGFALKREANDALIEKLAELARTSPAAFTECTLGEFIDDWMKRHAEQNCAKKTVERYRQLAGYLHSDVLAIQLREVKTIHLEREMYRLLESGGRHRKTKEARPLSAKTVRHIAALVSSALSDAEHKEILMRNPMKKCKLPPVQTKEKLILEPRELQAFLTAAQASPLYTLLVIASATGLRRGELLALTWRDFVMPAGVLNVSKSLEQTEGGLRVKAPKNSRPRRVPLPPTAVALLQSHRTDQDEARRLFGETYRADLDLIFCAPGGDFLKPDTVAAEVCRLARKSGHKGISLHSMRHGYGSFLLSQGASLPAVSRLLGHSSTAITGNTYAHALPQDLMAAAGQWEALMGPMLKDSETRQ